MPGNQYGEFLPLEQRFWNKVKKGSENECWEWLAYQNDSGYGILSNKNGSKFAHRISWELHFGKIKHNLCVCHRCDNPKCVNPKHLFLGTVKDNVNDKVSKGRQQKGLRLRLIAGPKITKNRFKGTYYHRQTNSWEAYINSNGKKMCLGYYKKEEDAAGMYQQMLKILTIIEIGSKALKKYFENPSEFYKQYETNEYYADEDREEV